MMTPADRAILLRLIYEAGYIAIDNGRNITVRAGEPGTFIADLLDECAVVDCNGSDLEVLTRALRFSGPIDERLWYFIA